MSASSTPPGARPLLRALAASGRHYAVACGAGIALLSLLNDTPVHVASLRGAIAWGSVLLAVRLGGWSAARAWVDPPAPPPEEGLEPHGDAPPHPGSRAA